MAGFEESRRAAPAEIVRTPWPKALATCLDPMAKFMMICFPQGSSASARIQRNNHRSLSVTWRALGKTCWIPFLKAACNTVAVRKDSLVALRRQKKDLAEATAAVETAVAERKAAAKAFAETVAEADDGAVERLQKGLAEPNSSQAPEVFEGLRKTFGDFASSTGMPGFCSLDPHEFREFIEQWAAVGGRHERE